MLQLNMIMITTHLWSRVVGSEVGVKHEAVDFHSMITVGVQGCIVEVPCFTVMVTVSICINYFYLLVTVSYSKKLF